MEKFKKSRNVLATAVLLGALLSGGQTLANESTSSATDEISVKTNEDVKTTVQDSVKVGGFWYKFDQFLQDLHITFTEDDEKKAKLLMSVAKERLEEANFMNETEQIKFLDSVMADYLKKLRETEELVGEIIFVSDLVDETKEELTDELEKLTDVNEEIEEHLPDDLKEELEETIERVTIVANVVKGIEPELVSTLRKQNLGFGQIVHLVALAEVSGKSVEEVTTYLTGEEKRGFGEVAKELGYHPGEIAVKVKESRLKADLEEAVETGNRKNIAKIEKQLSKVEDRKVKFLNKRNNQVQENKDKEENKSNKKEETNDEIIIVPEKQTDSEQERTNLSEEKRQDQVNKQVEKVEKKEEKQQEKATNREENSKGKGNQKDTSQ